MKQSFLPFALFAILTFPLVALPLQLIAEDSPFATSDGAEKVRFDFLEPGFTVYELPVRVTNLNNIEYTADGKLYAAGYDGRIHSILDTDGDGLEDTAKAFFEGKGDYDTPMGMVVRDNSVYLTLRRRIERFRDSNGDGVCDENEVVAKGWFDEATTKDKTFLHRRVDDALSLAIDTEGNFYTALGTPNYRDLYQLGEDGVSRYKQDRYRGSVVKISPDGSPQIYSTGVRFIIGMQFNKQGDLFATDQEGATWGPGNPFDELLHIRPGIHYGFPPRSDKYLPDVVDEPSVVDFGPQHQSTCGFRFNEERAGFKRFGPESWEGDAIVTGESRGKLWRVPLVKTDAGYIGRQVLIGATNLMPIDVTISPKGELLVCCHSGKPDWGTGPKGEGRLFKIVYGAPKTPRIAAVWPTSLTQIQVALDAPIPSDAKIEASVVGGRYVRAADELETFRPGYEVVVKEQAGAARHALKTKSVQMDKDNRNLTLTTSPHPWPENYGLKLSWSSETTKQASTFYADYTFQGVKATWTKDGDSTASWSGWLPSANLDVAREWTVGSTHHALLTQLLKTNGRLTMSGVLKSNPQPTAIDLQSSLNAKIDFGASSLPLSPNEAHSFSITIDTKDGVQPETRVLVTRLFESANGQQKLVGPLATTLTNIPDSPEIEAPGAPADYKTASNFVAGDPVKGLEVFKTSCAVCHAYRGLGSKVGPDLSNSPTRHPAGLQEDILNPNATLNPDYLTYGLELTNGNVVVGTMSSDRPGHFQVQQANGTLVEVDESEIEAMKQMRNSLMPTGLKEVLGDEKLRDLITFLISEPATK